MYRKRLEDLKAWKTAKNRLPLILRGARQVGKTWLLKEFGRACYRDTLYVNFENPGSLQELFAGDIEPGRILDYLAALHGKRIDPQNTLIIFDEVQEVPRALTSLKYFAENAPEYDICCAGSLLGIALHVGTSFPVGKVDFLDLQPMTFEEFVMAMDENTLCEYVRQAGLKDLLPPMEGKFLDLLKLYFIIGGMPAAVKEWIDTHDFSKVEKRQQAILSAYQDDFSKHAPSSVVPRIKHIWNSIPSQLSRPNKKFVYGLAREGARAREYEDALLWLQDCSLIRKVSCVSAPRLPLKAYEDLKTFKIYLSDIGLLRVMSELPPDAIMEETRIFTEFKGALTEQFVLQELSAISSIPNVYYWTSSHMAEIDFLFSNGRLVIPLEAKAGISIRAKSLKVYCEKHHPEIAIRTSLRDLDYRDGLLNLPLYVLWNLENYLREIQK